MTAIEKWTQHAQWRYNSTNGMIADLAGHPIAYVSAQRMTAADLDLGRGQAGAIGRLIAAAPDLYAGLQAALAMVDSDVGPPDWDALRAILKRARGETP